VRRIQAIPVGFSRPVFARDTIFALASGRGHAGVAVVRLSGPAAGPALADLTRKALPPPRLARRARLYRSAAETIDSGLVMWFPAPASFTGEDVAEFHVHGGRAVLAAMFETLDRRPGMRLAEPGEFTRRAFENGKLDLTAAEGLADLIAAETDGQRRQALRQLDGALGQLYAGWRGQLIEILALLEADIDFSEENLPPALTASAVTKLQQLDAEIRRHLDDKRRGERLRDGFSAAILGPVNVGKSSLINILAKRDAAIVAATAGTTRDVIEVHLDLAGLPVVVADTAGLRASDDAVEQEGVRRAKARAAAADLKIIMIDATAWPEIPADVAGLIEGPCLVLMNKTDLAAHRPPLAYRGYKVWPLSLATGEGLDAVLGELRRIVAEQLTPAENAGVTRVRHRRALEECLASLDRFSNGSAAPELLAEDVRLAARALGRITGQVKVDDVLDVVFREFCIGK
jgi:tRNA modification GTPase